MQVDYAVEIGPDEPALEFPWSSPDPAVHYFDLKADPGLVARVPEATGYPELAAFLNRINAPEFPLQTAKCDLWFTRELSPEEEIFGAPCKCGSYVDLVFAADGPRFSFDRHELLVKDLCVLLKRAPDMPAAVEFVVRQCHYHPTDDAEDSSAGFCVTAYVSGYDAGDEQARKRWGIALTLVQNALVQWAGRSPAFA